MKNYKLKIMTATDSKIFTDFGNVYFSSTSIAKKAITLYKEDLIKYFSYKG